MCICMTIYILACVIHVIHIYVYTYMTVYIFNVTCATTAFGDAADVRVGCWGDGVKAPCQGPRYCPAVPPWHPLRADRWVVSRVFTVYGRRTCFYYMSLGVHIYIYTIIYIYMGVYTCMNEDTYTYVHTYVCLYVEPGPVRTRNIVPCESQRRCGRELVPHFVR